MPTREARRRAQAQATGFRTMARGPATTNPEERSRLRGPVTTDNQTLARGPVTRRERGRVDASQRAMNSQSRQAALTAQQDANSSPLRRPSDGPPTVEPMRHSMDPRAAAGPPTVSRTEGFTQAEQARIVGEGNNPPTDGSPTSLRNEIVNQPTMAQQWQNATPEERAAMAAGQGIEQTLGPESLLLGAGGLRAGLSQVGRLAQRNAPRTAPRTTQQAPNLGGSGSINAGRGATGPGRNTPQKPRMRANPDGTFSPVAREVAAQTARGGLGRNAAVAGGVAATTPLLLSGNDGVQSEEDAAEARQAQIREVMANEGVSRNDARRSLGLDPQEPRRPNTAAPTSQDLLDRMERGETLRQRDFDAAGLDGRGGLRIDGDRQGMENLPAWMEERLSGGGGQRGLRENVPVTAQSRFEALRNRRFDNTTQEERREGARRGQERADLRSEAFGGGLSNEQQLRQELASPRGRMGELQKPPEQRAQEAEMLAEARKRDIEATNAVRERREGGRQADQTAALTARGQDATLAAAGLRAGGQQQQAQMGRMTSDDIARVSQNETPALRSSFERNNISGFYDGEDGDQRLAGAFAGFAGRANDMIANGDLPPMSVSATRDMFTLAHSLAAAESGGLFRRAVGFAVPGVSQTRGSRGNPAIDPDNALRLITEMVRNGGDGKWTSVGGQEFNLANLGPEAQQLYQRVAGNIRRQIEED